MTTEHTGTPASVPLAAHPRTGRPTLGSVRTAVVTGASSGIGRATAEALVATGWQVLAVARRAEKLETLAAETGCATAVCDVTDDASVAALADRVTELFPDGLGAVVANAGGAFGQQRIEDADLGDYGAMLDVNVLGSVRVVKALLPALRRAPSATVLLTVSSAAEAAYASGGGYNAAKAGQHMIARALRLELNGEPIRVVSLRPGMVATEEFSLTRLGDAAAAEKVYAGVEYPLAAEDVADVIAAALNLPPHVSLDDITVRPVAQADNYTTARGQGV